jgi:methionyl-tRNA formyltransferase
MRDTAAAHQLPIWDFADINSQEAIGVLRELAADLLVVCDYGQILSDECLATTRLGGINLHASLLPKYRGSAPIHWAIYRGETTTGVSVIHMSSRLDGGPILVRKEHPIGNQETTATLEPVLAELGVTAVADAIALLQCWDGVSALGEPQDPALVTRARRLNKSDGVLRWSRTARQLHNQIRAFDPWPGTWGELLRGDGSQLRLLIRKAEVVPGDRDSQLPGTLRDLTPHQLVVQTGSGGLSLLEVQPVGKKAQPIAEFLRGYRITTADSFQVAVVDKL